MNEKNHTQRTGKVRADNIEKIKNNPGFVGGKIKNTVINTGKFYYDGI